MFPSLARSSTRSTVPFIPPASSLESSSLGPRELFAQLPAIPVRDEAEIQKRIVESMEKNKFFSHLFASSSLPDGPSVDLWREESFMEGDDLAFGAAYGESDESKAKRAVNHVFNFFNTCALNSVSFEHLLPVVVSHLRTAWAWCKEVRDLSDAVLTDFC